MYRLIIISFVLLSFISCQTKWPVSNASAKAIKTSLIKIKTKDGKASYLQIINNDKKNTAYFSIAINNRGIYSMDKMADFIKSQYPGLTPGEQVWRFISTFSQQNKYITQNNWHNNPLLLMNSTGGSICGFRSSAMVNILKYMGDTARAWSLNGHVVSEVFTNGKWHVYDPYFGVIYFDKTGEVCSFEELCQNPQLITSPEKIISINNKCDSLSATIVDLANKYATQNDNSLFNTDYPKNEKSEIIQFELPPKAKLSFPMNIGADDKRFAIACLEIAPQWNGIIKIPLILYNVEGSAKVFLANKQIVNGKNQIKKIISSDTLFEDQIKIENNIEGVKLYYYINPLVYFIESENNIEITGNYIRNLNFKAIPYTLNNNPAWENSCKTEEFNSWLKFTSNCDKLKGFKVKSLEDYVHKVSLLNECGAFKEFNIDSAKTFHYIDSVSSKYKNNDTTFWAKYNRNDNFIFSIKEIISQTAGNTYKGQ